MFKRHEVDGPNYESLGDFLALNNDPSFSWRERISFVLASKNLSPRPGNNPEIIDVTFAGLCAGMDPTKGGDISKNN